MMAKSRKKAESVIWEYAKSFGIAFVLAFAIKTSIVEAYKIPSKSMEDTLLVGDFLLANKFVYGSRLPLIGVRLPAIREPQAGDVVIFKFPRDSSTNYIKRCVAVGGQVVEIKDKILYVDGKKFDNPPLVKFEDPARVAPAPQSPRDNSGPYKVPPGHYFMMGDNRDSSYDSRFWGSVPYRFIMGKAMIIHWSWGVDENAPQWSWTDPISVGKALIYNTFHFFQRVRWGRFADVIT